jgi:hypothetical protein
MYRRRGKNLGTMTGEDQKNYNRYLAAMHACQSAIALQIEKFGDAASAANAKHLRVGINSCLVDSSAVAQLLMKKGVFTEAEYLKAIADAAEVEQDRVTKLMREATGIPHLSFG